MGYIVDPYGQRRVLAPDEVIWDRYYNARDRSKGLAPLLLAAMPADMQREMLRFNRTFFRRGAVHSNLAFFLSELATSRQIDEFLERWDQRYAGADNAHRPVVGVGKGSVQNLGMSNADMEFIAGLSLTREMIADALGSPRS